MEESVLVGPKSASRRAQYDEMLIMAEINNGVGVCKVLRLKSLQKGIVLVDLQVGDLFMLNILPPSFQNKHEVGSSQAVWFVKDPKTGSCFDFGKGIKVCISEMPVGVEFFPLALIGLKRPEKINPTRADFSCPIPVRPC